jgi:succinate dehydrogenase / fumarate reductase, cytochrome b subunit
MSWFSTYIRSSIGMKQLMAVTGLILLGFVIAHLLGNLLIFAGPDAINSYAVGLRDLGPLLWIARLILLGAVLLHIFAAVRLVSINRAARPVRYQVFKPRITPYYARAMAWTGLIVAAFVVFHLLHLTFGAVYPEHFELVDAEGRHDVYTMTVLGFQNVVVSGFYVVAVGLLALHLAHGIPSLFQSLGLRHPKYTPTIAKVGFWLAVLLFIGYVSIPAAVLLRWLTV